MAKAHVRPVPNSWWLKKRAYFLFMLREWTSVFVAGYAVFLMVLVARAEDAESFGAFFQALLTPWSIVLHAITLAMVLYHTVTWLNLTPRVLVVWRGEQRVPGFVIAGVHYVGWLVVSAAVAWLVLG